MAEADETRAIQWVAYQERLKSSVLLCLGILTSAAVLLRQGWKLEMVQYAESYQALELSGLRKAHIRWLFFLRNVMLSTALLHIIVFLVLLI